MKLGFITALPQESKTLAPKALRPGETLQFGEHYIRVSGMGPDNAADATTKLIDLGVEAIISWGCAAGLSPSLAPGSLILPKSILSTQQTQHQSLPLKVSEILWQEAYRSLQTVADNLSCGNLVCSNEIIAQPTQKKRLGKQFMADALDMESYAIATTASNNNKPFLVVRAVSDTVDSPLPEAVRHGMNNDGSMNIMRFISKLISHPLDVIELIRLGINFKKASLSLKLASQAIPFRS